MKILYITSNYPCDPFPTSGIFIHRHVKKLLKKGCEIDVIHPVPWVPTFFEKKVFALCRDPKERNL